VTTDVAVTAGDGQVLKATVHGPDAARTWLVINSAMGVRRRFYRHLAGFLADRGIGTVTYDYRGMGESVVDPARADSVRLEDWGRRDFPAVVRWLRAERRPERVVALGHSVGGQLLGIAPEVRALDAVVGVATQSGHWRHWDGLQRARVFALWYLAIPLLAGPSGRFPAARLGLGQDLPAGVARQWAEWGRDPDYIRSPRVGPQPQYHGDVRCRLRTYWIAGDDLAPERAVRAWHDWFPHAERDFIAVPARNPSGAPIGHFGFFDPRVGGGEWADLADFVRG